jgi:hypothetical protein
MHYTTILPHACAQDVINAIHMLAAYAANVMQENQFRPQPLGLHVAEMILALRPIYVRDPRRRLFAIYNRLPGPGLPCGDRLVVVGIPYMPNCEDHRSGKCACERRQCIEMEVRIDSRFPLDPVETRWMLGDIFGVDESSIVDTHPSWLTRDPVPGGIQEVHDVEPNELGAPLSDTTRKLEAAAEELPNLRNNRHLMPQYLIWYKEEHGQEPSDRKGSFRHAMNGCIKRIEQRQRNQGQKHG